MSKIKVDTIQHTQHSNSTISLSNAGVTVNGNCTASSFTGDGANLTNLPVDLTQLSATNLTSGTIPDARFPATLPAVSGANLTNIAPGGALEFISKTTVSSAVSHVDITGFDYGYIYKLVLKHVVFSGGGGQYPEIQPFVNGATSPITNSACVYTQVTRNGTSGGSAYGYTAWQFYDGAGYHSGSDPFECSVEFSTDYRPHFRGFSQSYQSNAYSFSNVFGFFNSNITSESNVSSINDVRINGLRFKSSSGYNINSGQFILYRYKES